MNRTSMRWRDVFSSDGFATLVVAAASFTDTFMYDVAVPFLPQLLRNRFHLDPAHVQRWSSILLGVFGAAQLPSNVVAALITDRTGSKQTPFFAGLLFMAGGVFTFFLGTHIAALVISRTLQGISAALVWVSGLAFLTNHVDGDYLGFAMGMVTFGTAMGDLVGPVAGGLLYEVGGRNAVMGLALGVIGIDVVLRILLRDKPGAELSVDGDETRPLVGDAVAHSLEPGFAAFEPPSIPDVHNQSVTESSDDWTWIKDMACSWWAYLMTGIIRSMLESTIPLFVNRNFGWSSSESGGVMFAFLFPAVLSPWIGRFTIAYGPRSLSVICFAVNCAMFAGLAFAESGHPSARPMFVVLVAITGISGAVMTIAHTVAFSVAAKLSEVKNADGKGGLAGKCFCSMTIAWSLAMFAGPMLADVFLETVGWEALCFFTAALCFVTSIIMMWSWRDWKGLA